MDVWRYGGVGDFRQIDVLAGRQYGCFSINQARAAGFDRDAVARRTAQRAWIRLAPGVYAVASAPPIWERQLSASVLSHPRAIVGGAAAAALYEFPGFKRPRPVVIVPRTGNARSPIARVIRSAFFKTIATDRVRGFNTTTPAETLLTLAADLNDSHLGSLVDHCFLSGLATLENMERIYDRIGGARISGSARLRQLIESRHGDVYGVDSSYLERLLENVLRDPRVPASVREFPMTINGSASRVDAFIPSWDLVVEADSRRWHAREGDFEVDRQRDNYLASLGIQVVRLTYSMLKNDQEGCIETLISVGRHRSNSDAQVVNA
jgi:very-short-patch-repair endonuclease